MATQFYHGVQVVELQSGTRAIQTVSSSIIGLVGFADDADLKKYPLDTPFLITKREQIADFDLTDPKVGKNTIGPALESIFNQVNGAVVVVRVEKSAPYADPDTAESAAIALGIPKLSNAKSLLGVKPRIILSPFYSHAETVGKALEVEGKRLRAATLIDADDTTSAEAITYASKFSERRVMVFFPWIKRFDPKLPVDVDNPDAQIVKEPMSSVAAGLMARTDTELGFWHSPSNKGVLGILGTSQPIDFEHMDFTSTANTLNENNVTTIINENGYRLWGNRTVSLDPNWAFINVVRTADMIYDSLILGHMWAVDMNITTTYIDSVTDSVNAYLRSLRAQGAIIGGECRPSDELNTPEEIKAGKAYWDFDFQPPTPCENLTLRASLADDYLEIGGTE